VPVYNAGSKIVVVLNLIGQLRAATVYPPAGLIAK